MKKTVLKIIKNLGYNIIKTSTPMYNTPVPNELEKEFLYLYEQVKPYTMTSLERLYAAYSAAKYISISNIPGDIVECGVWRGGSSMMFALTLILKGDINRNLYLYDTFEGMPEPGEKDRSFDGLSGWEEWKNKQRVDHNDWCYASIEDVTKNIYSTGYPKKNIHIIKGKVEETIPLKLPLTISILRLDTDWYESTYHEMIHLFPLLSKYGVLIIDDYGHWKGAREAIDKYFEENKNHLLLNRIDYTGRMAIKTL